MTTQPFPLFLHLSGRRVVVVGGGPVAASKIRPLLEAGADVKVVAPQVREEIAAAGVAIERRSFQPGDLDDAWLAVAAATPEVNRTVAKAAEARRVFVNAVDDPAHASAFASGIVRRGSVTVAISTAGRAPALAGLLREGIDALLPEQVEAWVDQAEGLRARWRADAIPLGDRRPQLLRALDQLYAGRAPVGSAPVTRSPRAAAPRPPSGGFVSLVGAGPGDPDLLTVKAIRRLEEADLVLYDALVDGRVLANARRAHCFFVGKRAGRPSVQQTTIEQMLIGAARHGRRVVRLKNGDPFVFGRGGEEVQALAEAGIPHEVIPGLSSALAAPALAGIPLTHRGIAAGFTVVSGHAEAAYRPIVEALAPGGATLVVLMGLATRARLADVLVSRGWDPATPAAMLLSASEPDASTWIGTLAQLPAAPIAAERRDCPGTLVIGEVVALAAARGAPVLRAAGDRRQS